MGMASRRNYVCIAVGMVVGFVLSQAFGRTIVQESRDLLVWTSSELGSPDTSTDTSAALAYQRCEASLVALQQTVHEGQLQTEAFEDKAASCETRLAQKTEFERACRGTLSKMYEAASGIMSAQHPENKPFLKVLAGG